MTNEIIENIFAAGSRWFRADFHLHTQADKEFKPKENKHSFVSKYIERLKEEDIRIGVITNHNKFDLDEFKTLRKAAKKEGIFLLPGVELSVNDGQNGVHCLITFDYDTWIHQGNNHIQGFLSGAFVGVHNPENENSRCNYSLETVFEKLGKHRKNGRDSFIVLAHVEDNSGFFKEFGGGRIKELGEKAAFWENILGIQKARTRDKMAKWEQHLGKKLPALLEGSDCKSPETVGKAHQSNGKEKRCYVKIGSFQFQALKYALLDYPHRVAPNPPEISHALLKKIKFNGSRIQGELILTNNLNTLIGIRGSGKSSILELIRYALDLEASTDSNYKKSLVEVALGSGGLIELYIKCKDGKTYSIRRVNGENPVVYEDKKMLQITARKLLQEQGILYYGQKDLSYRKEDANERLFEGLIADRLADVKSHQKEQEGIVIEKISAFQNQSSLYEKKEEYKEEQQALNHRLKVYKEKKIDQKLAKQAQFQNDLDQLEKTKKALANIKTRLGSSFDEIKKELDGYINYSSKQNPDLFENLTEKLIFLKTRIAQYEESIGGIEDIKKEVETNHGKLDLQYKTLLEEFARIQQEINEPNLRASDYLEATKKLKEITSKLGKLEEAIGHRTKLRGELYSSLQQLNKFWHEEFSVLKAGAKEINDQELPISIKVDYKARKGDMLSFLQSIMKGQNIQTKNLNSLCEVYPDFIQMFSDIEDDKGQVTKILSGGMQYDKFKERFFSELEQLLVYRPADRVTIEYNGKPLQEHSLGQRASAVILFLLTQQDNNIVLIDQPEDDLDNQSIFEELIHLLLKQKDQTQFVFATHNPNIPVLGDAERIIVMKYENENMAVETGNIDHPEIQKSIIKIMEGGKAAFERRKEIYHSWKH